MYGNIELNFLLSDVPSETGDGMQTSYAASHAVLVQFLLFYYILSYAGAEERASPSAIQP